MSAPTLRQQEIRVGLFVLAAALLVVAFAWIMGVFNPFKNTIRVNVHYNFAGSITTGSPVRVSGVTVGKIEEVIFTPDYVDENKVPAPVTLVLSIQDKAKDAVRTDSRYFINLAGLIGEKYLEITPGSMDKPAVQDGDHVRGIDPPRVDELISQSYGLAGDIRKMFNEKEDSIKNTIELLLKVTENLNKLFDRVGSQKNINAQKLDELFNNFVSISHDLHELTARANSPDGRRAAEVLHTLIMRMEKLDEKSMRKFLQEEGVRARITF